MARATVTFSFHKAAFREGTNVPTFVLPGKIRGTIHIAQQYEESFDVAKIVLKGRLETGITLSVCASGLVQMRSLQQTFLELVDTRPNIRTINSEEDEAELSVPFIFVVPKPALEGQGRDLPAYPPSLSVGKQYLQGAGSNIRAHGFVQYQVEVHLCTRSQIICSRQAEIGILNGVTDPPPPIPLDDFPYDYICSTSKSLSGGKIRTWFAQRNTQKPRLHLTIETGEPHVLCLHPVLRNKRLESVDLEILFKMSRLLETADIAHTWPDDLHVTLTWSLKTTTFVAVVPMEELPTRAETATDPFVTRTSTYTPAHSAKTILRDWYPVTDQRHAIGITSNDEHQPLHQVQQAPVTTASETLWSAKQNFHLAIADTTDCLTTFSTPYISRRHTLQLQLECHSWKTVTAQFKLEVPIQIAMRGDAADSESSNGSQASSAPYLIDGEGLTTQAYPAASPLYVR